MIKNIRLSYQLMEPVLVNSHTSHIERITTNLLSNLLKYAPKSASSAISVYADDEFGILEVSNSGSYIPEDKQQFIFKRFSRLDEHRSILGAGIGLALVDQILESTGGNIKVLSGDTGVTFRVSFPLSERKPSHSTIQPLSDSNWHEIYGLEEWHFDLREFAEFEQTILIIDDNREMSRCLAIGLQKDFNIIVANDVREGLRLALNRLPDMVITDLLMPELDGFEICEMLKTNSLTMHIPVIILTAQSSADARLTAWQKLADEL